MAEDNTFELIRPYPETLQLQVSGLPAPYYVSEIQYAGQPVHDGIVALNSMASAQMLTVRALGGHPNPANGGHLKTGQ